MSIPEPPSDHRNSRLPRSAGPAHTPSTQPPARVGEDWPEAKIGGELKIPWRIDVARIPPEPTFTAWCRLREPARWPLKRDRRPAGRRQPTSTSRAPRSRASKMPAVREIRSAAGRSQQARRPRRAETSKGVGNRLIAAAPPRSARLCARRTGSPARRIGRSVLAKAVRRHRVRRFQSGGILRTAPVPEPLERLGIVT